MRNILGLFGILLLCSFSVLGTAFAQSQENLEEMFNTASDHLVNGDYKQAITIYDKILEISPNNISTLKMKGIVQSNLDEHANSLKQFYKVLQYKPNDVTSLTGMGIGFGYLGEYQESIKYFEKASDEEPDSVIVNNYKDFINNVISKYPYTATEKPEEMNKLPITSIPDWVRQIAMWWSEGTINDDEFNSALIHLIENKIIQIPPVKQQNQVNGAIPEWVKNNAGWWADGEIDDESFVLGINHLIENGLIIVTQSETDKSQKELDKEFYYFEKYLKSISKNIIKEKRYIEFPNPSQDVIKKFLRDYVKWNFEEEVKRASEKFPNPTYQIDNGVHIIHYKVFINDQPTGLPLDHASTLKESFMFWQKQAITSDEKGVIIEFEVTNLKHEANVWITWVVRNIGDGVLGHAQIGKGVVEVTLGDYNCDGSFQLYDIESVKTIMTHELGHSIGLHHASEQNNIMYPSYAPSYAYCLLS